MKRFLIYMILFAAGFVSGCKKNNDPVLEDPDKRLSAELAGDEAKLLAAGDGWLGTIYPKGGKGFSFYFKFTPDGKVSMLSDFNSTSATTPTASTYRLKALQRPTLIFDTYNYIHLPADPDAVISGGSASTATGLTSDFEFAFTEFVGDTIKFVGTFNKNPMKMVKVSSSTAQSILAGGLKTMVDANAAYLLVNKNPFILFDDGTKGAILIDVTAKTIKLNYLDSKEVSQLQTVTFAYGINKIMLSSTLKYGNVSFNELLWDAQAKAYYIMVGTTRINVQNSAVPIIPLNTLFAPVGKDYSQIEYNPLTVATTLSADFTTKYATSKTGLAAVGNAGRVLDYMRVLINTDNTMTLRFYYHNTAGTNFQANFTYSYTRDANGIYKFVYLAADGNGGVVGAGFVSLRDYFSNNTFKVDWVVNPGGGAPYGGFYTVANPASFYYGTLLK